MKKSVLTICLFVFAAMFVFSQTYSGGSGTVGAPYQIGTKTDLKYLSEHSADWAKYFIQTADIIFEDADFQSGGSFYNSGAGFSPIGSSTTAFTGSYNGQGFSIIGLYIYRPGTENVGLFGYITGNGSATIANLFIQGTITGSSRVAALVGNIASSNILITNCHSNATITSTRTTSDSYADTGGLIGLIASGAPTITNCSSSGTVTGQGLRNLGGLIAYVNSGTVQKSFSTANVVNSASNQGNTGGFIGGINSNGNNTLIEDCFACGSVSGGVNNNSTEWRNGIGGFIGTKRTEYTGYTKTIRNCYATGIVSQTGSSTDIGGFIGRFANNFAPSVNPTITNCFWDTQRTTQATSAGGAGTGLTTAQMKVQADFTGWDFANTWRMSSTITYDGYPTLEWGKGYATAPTSNQIADLSNLVYVAENSSRWATSYTQTADMNAWWTCGWDYQKGFTPIGNNTTKYTGTTYDGDGYDINHLFINRSTSDYQGLFGYLNGTEVKDLGLNHVNISAKSSLAGIAGAADNGTIRNCFVTGSVRGIGASADYTGGLIGDSRGNSLVEYCYTNMATSGLHHVGGLAGRILNDAGTSVVRYCYSLGTVTGTGSHIGGLAGGNSGTINNSYSSVKVGGTGTNVGGLVGHNWYGAVENSYSVGPVTGSVSLGGLVGATTGSTVTNSFWDTQTSGRATSAGGTGKTTAEMKTQSTFTGWDFTTIWDITDLSTNYSSYPYLNNNPQNPLPGYEYILFTWDGSVSIDWNTTGNWSGNVIPTAIHNVIIPGEGIQPIISSGVGANCNNLTINTGATLTIQSGGSLITMGSITNNGTFDIQRTITKSRWHLISPPIANATALLFEDDYLQTWSEPIAAWTDIVSTGTSLSPAKGYSLWTMYATDHTYTFSGTPNTGDISTSLTAEGTGGLYNRANLLGNPYPSAIDWSMLDNTYGAVYYWQGNGTDGDGTYLSWNNGSGDGSQYIAPAQGFFIVAASAGTFSLTNANRTHTMGSFYKSSDDTRDNLLVLETVSKGISDKLYLKLDPFAEEGFELSNDAYKFFADSDGISQLYSLSGDNKLSIDVRPVCDVVELGFTNTQAGDYQIGLSEINGFDEAMLEDAHTGTFTDLLNKTYTFSYVPGEQEQRFKLHFNTILSNADKKDITSNIYSYRKTTYINLMNGVKGDIYIYNVAGQLVATKLSAKGMIEIGLKNTGNYIVKVVTDKSSQVKKIFIR